MEFKKTLLAKILRSLSIKVVYAILVGQFVLTDGDIDVSTYIIGALRKLFSWKVKYLSKALVV